jgi:hypothetical protein
LALGHWFRSTEALSACSMHSTCSICSEVSQVPGLGCASGLTAILCLQEVIAPTFLRLYHGVQWMPSSRQHGALRALPSAPLQLRTMLSLAAGRGRPRITGPTPSTQRSASGPYAVLVSSVSPCSSLPEGSLKLVSHLAAIPLTYRPRTRAALRVIHSVQLYGNRHISGEHVAPNTRDILFSAPGDPASLPSILFRTACTRSAPWRKVSMSMFSLFPRQKHVLKLHSSATDHIFP